jgi:Ribbon-helix-helix protein, copG family
VKKTSLYLDRELDEALARRAADEGLTKAELIRRLLVGAIQRPPRSKPSVGVFRSTDGGVARDLERYLAESGFGED